MVGERNLEEEFEGLVKNILIRAKDELEKLQEWDFPYDFNSNAIQDIVFDEVDSFVSGFDRQECLAWIDFCNNEQWVDKGVIDTSSIDRILLTTAFECIRMKVFDDDLINDLQEYELTKEKRDEFLKRISERLGEENEYTLGEDTDTQIFIKTEFELKADDFKEPFFAKEQIVELGGGNIKILNNPLDDEINRNAIVIEKKRDGIYRIYLMDKSDEIDIREYFDKKHFDDKDELINIIADISNDAFFKVAREKLGNKTYVGDEK